MVLALLVGVVGGLAMGAAIGARRTATVPGRLTAALDGRVDVQILDLGAVDLATIEGLPMVERAAVSRFLVSDVEYDLTATTDQTFAMQLIEGEVAPDDPFAAVLDGTTARMLGVGVGDEVDLELYSAEQWAAQDPSAGPRGPHVTARVAGLVREPDDLDAADPRSFASQGSNGTFALPSSFLEQLGEETGVFTNVFTSVQLERGPADVPAFKAAVRELPGGEDLAFLDAEETQNQSAARRAVRVQALALGALAAALALAGAVTVGQLLVRHLRADASDTATLQALGMTAGERARVGLVRGLVLGGLSAPLAVAAAVAVSSFTPVGVARQGEPHPGIDVNAGWLAVGSLAIVLLVTTVATLGARSSVRAVSDRDIPSGARPAGSIVGAVRGRAGAVVTTALALSFGTRASRLTTRAATTALVAAVITVVGGAVLVASFDRVADSPERFGWSFDAVAGNPYEEDPGDLFEMVDQTTGVESATRAAGVALEVEGRSVSVLAVEPEQGIALRPIDGEVPSEPDEIALGRRTLHELQVAIGETVEVDAGSGAVELTVSGTLVVPELTGLGTGLGDGGVITLAALERLAPRAQPNLALLAFRPGGRDGAVESFTARSQDVQPLAEPYLPAALYQFIRIEGAFALLGVLVVLLALGTVVHSIVGAGQHRRREVAILRALGFTRRQVMASALSHAATCAVVALTLGLPLGVAVGRLAWIALRSRLGLPDGPAVPLGGLVVLVPSVLLLVLMTAAGPGWWVARQAPSRPIRSE